MRGNTIQFNLPSGSGLLGQSNVKVFHYLSVHVPAICVGAEQGRYIIVACMYRSTFKDYSGASLKDSRPINQVDQSV